MNDILPSSVFNMRRVKDGKTHELGPYRRLTLGTRCLCQRCNNGWLSDLENDVAKPALAELIRVDSKRVALTDKKLSGLAIFLFKCGLVGDYMNRQEQSYFSAADRKRFARSLEIPEGIQMWIARYRGRADHAGIFKTLHFKTARHGPVPPLEFFTFTFGAGILIVQMLAGRFASTVFRKQYGSFPVQQREDYPSIPFWPLTGQPLLWPFQKAMDDDLLKRFAERWTIMHFQVPGI